MRSIRALAVSLLLALTPSFGLAQDDICAVEHLDIRSQSSIVRFSVEVVDTAQTRAVGLMNRPKLAQFSGMLFVYPEARAVNFWMRNTLIPLDMIFLDSNGVVQHVHENAIPHDETPIPGGFNIQYVLEINGGLARELGIKAGSELRHPALTNFDTKWPCE